MLNLGKHDDEGEDLLLSAAVEQATESIVITDSYGIIRYVNHAFEVATQYSRDEAIGRNIDFIDGGIKGNISHAELWDRLNRGNAWSGRMTSRKKDGTTYQEEVTISPLRDQSGKVISSVSARRDITETLAMEMQLRQAQKLESIGRLAAGIAHEINTPMQYVGDNTRFLQDSFVELIEVLQHCTSALSDIKNGNFISQTIADALSAIEKADIEYLTTEIPDAISQSLEGIERVAKIVRAMKEFSHPGKEEKTATDINRAIETTITVARNEWKYVSDVETDFDKSLPMVPCLPGEFNQVILNLIINAAHAIGSANADKSSGKGLITVKTAKDGDTVRISISDTGTGIPEEVRSKIFDPFFTTKEVGRGTGQGLYVARSVVVEKHGGSIDLETEVGKGTTFIIRLPINCPSSEKEF